MLGVGGSWQVRWRAKDQKQTTLIRRCDVGRVESEPSKNRIDKSFSRLKSLCYKFVYMLAINGSNLNQKCGSSFIFKAFVVHNNRKHILTRRTNKNKDFARIAKMSTNPTFMNFPALRKNAQSCGNPKIITNYHSKFLSVHPHLLQPGWIPFNMLWCWGEIGSMGYLFHYNIMWMDEASIAQH